MIRQQGTSEKVLLRMDLAGFKTRLVWLRTSDPEESADCEVGKGQLACE